MTAAHEEEWALDDGLIETPDPNLGNEEEANEAPELTPVEQLAMKAGWKPEAEWKGDKSGWTPADQYLETTITKQREATERAKDASRHLRASQRAYDELQARLDKLTSTTTKLAVEQEQRHRAELQRFFEAEKKKAAKDGNDDLYDDLLDQQRQAEQALDQKFKREPEVDYNVQAQEMLTDPIVGKFLREHAWVVQDEEAYSYAFAIAQDLADAGHPKSVQIRAVKEALREEYPDRFKAGASAQPTPQRGRAAPAATVEDNEPPPWDVTGEQARERETPAQDPDTGRFVPKKDAHLYQQPQQQAQRRPAAAVQSGHRVPQTQRMASPEAAAWNSLPAEARAVFQEQKKSGSFKGDIIRFAKIYNGDTRNVLD